LGFNVWRFDLIWVFAIWDLPSQIWDLKSKDLRFGVGDSIWDLPTTGTVPVWSNVGMGETESSTSISNIVFRNVTTERTM